MTTTLPCASYLQTAFNSKQLSTADSERCETIAASILQEIAVKIDDVIANGANTGQTGIRVEHYSHHGFRNETLAGEEITRRIKEVVEPMKYYVYPVWVRGGGNDDVAIIITDIRPKMGFWRGLGMFLLYFGSSSYPR